MKNLKIFTNNIEEKATNEINLLLNQDAFKNCKIRIMPDVHAGMGCVIGFTANLGDKVIPNIVGVDIGCGMLCIELGNIDLDLESFDMACNNYIESGFNIYKTPKVEYEPIKDLKCYKELKNKDNFNKAIGTLGGGNHFIEIDIDENDNKYLVIHTGSRNLGKQVADFYQKKAIIYCLSSNPKKEDTINLIKELKSQGRENEIQEELKKLEREVINIPKDLCYLENQDRLDYLHDMKVCQKYASLNRKIIAKRLLKAIGFRIIDFNVSGTNLNYEPYNNINLNGGCYFNCFETIHNYISFDDNIVRKGAISAQKGEKVLIPINMKDGCIIAKGKGNDDWNCSAPHGAGRIMSRMKAKEMINLEDFKESMKEVYSTSVCESTLDEAPFVYKPMQEIIDNIKDTVEILNIIKPIYNFKSKN